MSVSGGPKLFFRRLVTHTLLPTPLSIVGLYLDFIMAGFSLGVVGFTICRRVELNQPFLYDTDEL